MYGALMESILTLEQMTLQNGQVVKKDTLNAEGPLYSAFL